MIRGVALLFFYFFILIASAQEGFFLKKDLQSDWRVFINNSYQPISENDQPRVIYFFLPVELYKGDNLLIESPDEFAVFINGRMMHENISMLTLPVDSINTVLKEPSIFFSVYCRSGIRQKSLKTLIVSKLPAYSETETGPVPRARETFKNFTVTALLTLVILFAFLLRFNPKQTSDSFSVLKLFSLRESDDSQAFSRIANSANLLVFVFASLATAFVIILLHRGLSQVQTVFFTQPGSFAGEILHWLQLSAVILGLLLVKAILVSFFAILFDIRDQSGYQFQNFIRFILTLASLLAVAGTFYFIVYGEGGAFRFFLYKALKWMIMLWPLLAVLKLLRRVHFSMFHLFSYICATEIIPFLIVIKILYE